MYEIWKGNLQSESQTLAPGKRPYLPYNVAFAVSFQGDDPPAELDKVLPDEKHAAVSLQRHGGDVQQAVALPLQQLVEFLFQEDLTGDFVYIFISGALLFGSSAHTGLTLLTPSW